MPHAAVHQIVRPILLVICWAAALLAVTTAIRIDRLNARAGHILPRVGERGDDGSLVKWRTMAVPETPAQTAENELHDLVSSWGMLQYLLIPVATAISITLAARARTPRPTRIFALLALAPLFYAGWRTVSLAYLTSLAW